MGEMRDSIEFGTDELPGADWTRHRLRAELAILRARLEGGAKVAVKPLEWREYKSFGGTKLLAFDPFGNEFARLDNPDRKGASEIEAFKEARQADYERRILSALTTPPAPAGDALATFTTTLFP